MPTAVKTTSLENLLPNTPWLQLWPSTISSSHQLTRLSPAPVVCMETCQPVSSALHNLIKSLADMTLPSNCGPPGGALVSPTLGVWCVGHLTHHAYQLWDDIICREGTWEEVGSQILQQIQFSLVDLFYNCILVSPLPVCVCVGVVWGTFFHVALTHSLKLVS